MKKLLGVNLGGWLVLEKWMTPKLFEGTEAEDEYTFMMTSGAEEKLRQHHDEFITEEDFQWMSQNGVNSVRIPVGYWILEGDLPYVSSVEKLDWAFSMAEKYQIEVIISLHGAPGSQNGHDHSGRIGKALWYQEKANRAKTIQTLVELAHRYRENSRFWGLELLNEPKTKIFQFKLRRFYKEAYQALSDVLKPTTHVIFHDTFTPRMMSGAIKAKEIPVVMDIHWYHFITSLKGRLPQKWYLWILSRRHKLIARLSHRQPVIVGEWNGILAGEYLSQFPVEEHNIIVKDHIERQLAAYSGALGHFYWNYKTQERGVFHFRSFVEDGIIDLKPYLTD